MLLLGILETKLYKSREDTMGLEISQNIEHSFRRKLDDCFILFNTTLGDLNAFLEMFNNLDKNIQFKIENSTTELPFLHILLKRENDKIITHLYYKPTHTKIFFV